MTTEDDFQTAIDAHPEDWQTRLVFADWLDEHNDPRGGVIRLAERVRHLGPEATAREYAAHRDALRRGLGHWLWVQVMGHEDLAHAVREL